MQIGYLAAVVSMHTGRTVPAIVEEVEKRCAVRSGSTERSA
jgi:hypothetical protein